MVAEVVGDFSSAAETRERLARAAAPARVFKSSRRQSGEFMGKGKGAKRHPRFGAWQARVRGRVRREEHCLHLCARFLGRTPPVKTRLLVNFAGFLGAALGFTVLL